MATVGMVVTFLVIRALGLCLLLPFGILALVALEVLLRLLLSLLLSLLPSVLQEAVRIPLSSLDS